MILNERAKVLSQNPKAFAGNSLLRRQYLSLLNQYKVQLLPFQAEAVVGLVLSDATIDVSSFGLRIKIQQSAAHSEFIKHLKFDLFKEYSGNDNPIQPSIRNMYDFTSLSCKQFTDVSHAFCKTDSILDSLTAGLKTKRFPKAINFKKIKPYLTPVALAYWFCGDGGTTESKGKRISLATNGFLKEDVEFLATTLCEFGLIAEATVDKPAKAQYRIDISGKSFEDFIIKVGPFIHSSMVYKLPPGRVANSPYGFMTEAEKQRHVSVHFFNDDWIYYSSSW